MSGSQAKYDLGTAANSIATHHNLRYPREIELAGLEHRVTIQPVDSATTDPRSSRFVSWPPH